MAQLPVNPPSVAQTPMGGPPRNWGCPVRGGYVSLLFFDRGWSVKWILKLVAAGGEGPWVDVMEISKPDGLGDIGNLGLTLAEAKHLLAQVQREISIAQAAEHAVRRPVCPCLDGVCQTKAGGRQVFGGVAKAGTDFEELIRKNLDAVGGNKDTVLTAFTDGCPGLRRILADAGVMKRPMLDWFHIGMKLQHLKQIADGLAAGDPARAAAKAVIVTEVDRLHWRIWNGKAKNARKSIDRIRAVMHHFRGEQDTRKSIASSRKFWTALRALNKYLTGQSAWLVNYAERHREGLVLGPQSPKGRRISW